MLLPPFTAALFDLDGTLVNTEPRSRAAWQQLFRAHDVPLEPAELAAFAGRPGMEAIAHHLSSFPGHTAEALYREALGYALGPDALPAEPVTGALSLLQRLRDEEVSIGVVTSGTGDYARAELDALGVLPLLDVLITADDVERGKPDPQGYLAGCAAIGAQPVETIVFEDAPAGIQAAKRAGAFCVALTTTHSGSDLDGADLIVRDLAQITWPLRHVSA
ncbi:HAD family hydrolase [Streptomyces sp. NBC_01727]|uniref:HAD family hydrolase n=1 Tax=Streptomyces sp. NBC_01727 TaxID=2975924 RepID=UPI002E11C05C|nr:HAD-IA family hydrolase [Streptomyces sp. NBC_01727]